MDEDCTEQELVEANSHLLLVAVTTGALQVTDQLALKRGDRQLLSDPPLHTWVS